MHEMSLAESVVRIVEEVAQRERARRVRSVSVEIGRLAAVEPQALAFCLDAASRGTLAEGAEFRLIDVAGSGWCAGCARELPMTTSYDGCPGCGGPLRLTRGNEMRVSDVEIE